MAVPSPSILFTASNGFPPALAAHRAHILYVLCLNYGDAVGVVIIGSFGDWIELQKEIVVAKLWPIDHLLTM